MSDITRRQVLTVGATGVAGLATAIAVGQAKSQYSKARCLENNHEFQRSLCQKSGTNYRRNVRNW